MPSRPPSRCPNCRRLKAEPGRCQDCRREQYREQDARRPGTTASRGYDARHQREAREAKARAIREGQLCPRCGLPMLYGQALDYGHTVARAIDPTARADRVEHASCNRSAGHRHG